MCAILKRMNEAALLKRMNEAALARALHAMADDAPGDDAKRAELHALIDEALGDGGVAETQMAQGSPPVPETEPGVVTPEGVHVVPAVPGVDPADLMQPPPVPEDEEPIP